uniref:Uncharacterized protein n=1 Tax=Cucumis melo TaxID=3656 RepID=A0A9I9E814_CUCME
MDEERSKEVEKQEMRWREVEKQEMRWREVEKREMGLGFHCERFTGNINNIF